MRTDDTSPPTWGQTDVPPSTGAVWHTLAVAEVAAGLRTDAERRLDPSEAACRLRDHGPNALATTPGRPRWPSCWPSSRA